MSPLDQIGRYHIKALIGRGAMGEVYRALDPQLDREVAVKIIAHLTSDVDGSSRKRFRREVQAAGRLNHPRIVTVYDVDLEHEPPYVVMELLPGGTLAGYLAENQLDWRAALKLLRPLCGALSYAHEAGIVHRDVKPDNVLFSSRPEEGLKLVDFGLAYRKDAERLTQTGGFLGTVAYLSPEQANGEPVDARADIFSLGVILFEAIAGYNPLQGKTVSQTLLRAASYEPIDMAPLEESVPEPVLNILKRALAKDRRQRYAGGNQLDRDIGALLERGKRVAARRKARSIEPELPIKNPFAISLPDGASVILGQMFTGYSQIAIEEELGGGFSGSRVFVVRPVRSDGTPELPAVVKMGTIRLIEREWQAYQEHIRDQLPGVAEIRGEPVIPSESAWGGIRYPLVGSGTFHFESLTRYYRQASAAQVGYVLRERLFRQMGLLWRFNVPVTDFDLGGSYDHLLPVNLVVRPLNEVDREAAIALRAGHRNSKRPAAGDYVHLSGYVVEEVDPRERSVTLNWPAAGELPASHRVRLRPVSNLKLYQVGHVLDSLDGQVSTTRQTALKATVLELLGVDFAASVAELALPGKRLLPNPLDRLPAVLAAHPTVRAASIHGDLNPENILVDPDARDVRLIDFETARRDHVLHDLLRLETGIVTRLLPGTLKDAKLPVEAVIGLYEALHCAAFARPPLTSPDLVHHDLEKPFAVLLALRQTATNYLFDPGEPDEYYQGLTLYLLGTLKYRNLDRQAKLVAFWGASAAQGLIDAAPPCTPAESLAVAPAPVFQETQDVNYHLKSQVGPAPRPTTPASRPSILSEVGARLAENWLPALLLGLLAFVLLYALIRGDGGERSEPVVEAPAPTQVVATPTPSPTQAPATPTSIPARTPTPRPTVLVSVVDLVTQQAPQSTLALDDRLGETTVALLLDTSASMRNDDKLRRSLAGAIVFLNRLDDSDEVLAYKYGDQVIRLEPAGMVEGVHDALTDVLKGLFAGGEPLLYDALCEAAETLGDMSSADPNRLFAIVLLTDGQDSGRGQVLDETDALACLSASGGDVAIHAIALGDEADELFLSKIVDLTDGQLYRATTADIIDTYAQITFE